MLAQALRPPALTRPVAALAGRDDRPEALGQPYDAEATRETTCAKHGEGGVGSGVTARLHAGQVVAARRAHRPSHDAAD